MIACRLRPASTRRGWGIKRFVAAVAFGLLVPLSPPTDAHETDQYTLPLGQEFADLGVHFSRMVHDAIAAAASLAGLEDYAVEFVEPYRTPREMFLQRLADSLGRFLGQERGARLVTGLAGLLQPLHRAARELEVLQDPRHLYMRCLACGMTR